ncbi:calcium-binding protein [Azospirillum sp.]|uniref:calcium-binding protein n=1 Tax=Azospirillum sp. TaxID=34012 RepID=UPI002D4B9E90|nr:calcium-binding protein [Azospirillum sp.]HYD64197.1 calcium-binding protein [Azospirillum sp.]
MALITGTIGNDLLSGTADADVISALDGDDTVLGEGGNDTLWGGFDNDLLSGALGDDVIYGNLASDTLLGDAGVDTLYGGQGSDTLSGADGDDVLYGNMMSDVMLGDGGNDTMFGGQGNDTLSGALGNDFLWGNRGDDLNYGDDGNDTISDGEGSDTIYGGFGDDILDGGHETGGLNRIYGEEGNDGLGGGWGNDVLDGGAGNDFMFGRSGIDTLYGGLGDDTIWTGDSVRSSDDSTDLAYGGEGNDLIIILEERPWHDGSLPWFVRPRSIYGDAGNDTIDASAVDTAVGRMTTAGLSELSVEYYGGEGGDLIKGAAFAEEIHGGAGDDTLYGGIQGRDTYYHFNAGMDTIHGGDGNDILALGPQSLSRTATGGVLSGGAGEDTLYAANALPAFSIYSAGPTLAGGADTDLFVANAVGHKTLTEDRVMLNVADYQDGVDRIQLSGFGMTGAVQFLDAGTFRSVGNTVAYKADADGTNALTAYVHGGNGELLAIRIVGVRTLDATDIAFI